MTDIEDDPSPGQRDFASDPAAADSSEPPKVCKDCGASVKGHWRYKRKGEYYCRVCYRRHLANLRLQHRLRRATLICLAVVVACLLVLIVCFIADESRAWLYWIRPRR